MSKNIAPKTSVLSDAELDAVSAAGQSNFIGVSQYAYAGSWVNAVNVSNVQQSNNIHTTYSGINGASISVYVG